MSGVASENLRILRALHRSEAQRLGLKEVQGVASFKKLQSSLLPVQMKRLTELSGNDYDNLLLNGSVISIAYAYPEEAIESIANWEEGAWDKKKWDVYAQAYKRLNAALNETSRKIASEFSGVAVTATTTGMTSTVTHVEDYYPTVVSHRVAAELSGVGWRGKNELIVNPRFSCAIRLATILTTTPIENTPPSSISCGECRVCLDSCKFLTHKDKLDNYREQCRRYLLYLDLDEEVCGKCIKACYMKSIYKDQFQL
jgi:epoxyqueuosine reductase QueG